MISRFYSYANRIARKNESLGLTSYRLPNTQNAVITNDDDDDGLPHQVVSGLYYHDKSHELH